MVILAHPVRPESIHSGDTTVDAARLEGVRHQQPSKHSGSAQTGCMREARRLTAIIEREDDGFVAFSPELDIASQGQSIEEARANLIEALSLFFETASPSEVSRRLHSEVFVTQVEVPVGQA